MNNKKTQMKLATLAVMAMLAVACRKQPTIPPAIVNEPENITTVKVTLTDSANTANVVSAAWRDVDGAGGNAPTIENLTLAPNKTYLATITILDETKSPVAVVSDEVLNEGKDHQFFFQKTGTNISFSYNDEDGNGNPIGLKSKWRTGAVSTGNVTVILKHQPGVKVAKPGDINAGETDLEVTYTTTIQ